MARPIKETPILFGEDARRFEERMKQVRRESPEERERRLANFELAMKMLELGEQTKKEYLKNISEVALSSDAFFPFSDNIERAYRSGVRYIAEPGGSVRDDDVIKEADKLGVVMAFTGIRLFHH